MIRIYNVHHRITKECLELDAMYAGKVIATADSIKEIEAKIHEHANGKQYRIKYIL